MFTFIRNFILILLLISIAQELNNAELPEDHMRIDYHKDSK